MIGIYKIENLLNHHVYIGQSVDIQRRWIAHKNAKDDLAIHSALKKYGVENFSFDVLEECDKEKLGEKEVYWINFYDSYRNGYNSTSGGEGNPNNIIKLSDEQISQIYDLLINSDLTQREIAKQFSVGEDTISEINHGKTRIRPNFEYPLRKNRGKKQIKTCPKCGKQITFFAKLCNDCSRKESRFVQRPDREELKQLIRNQSFTSIGKIYKVSDNAIRKWCISENLPSKKKDIRNYSDEEWKNI